MSDYSEIKVKELCRYIMHDGAIHNERIVPLCEKLAKMKAGKIYQYSMEKMAWRAIVTEAACNYCNRMRPTPHYWVYFSQDDRIEAATRLMLAYADIVNQLAKINAGEAKIKAVG